MKKTILVDLDGVLAEYNGWKGVENIGAPIPGAVEFTQKLSQVADIVIYTTRTNPETNPGYTQSHLVSLVQRWLELNGFRYKDIYCGNGKPIAAGIVDDRAVYCRPDPAQPHSAEAEYHKALMKCCQLTHNIFPTSDPLED